jgi:molybdopterin synthase catalytic subunit
MMPAQVGAAVRLLDVRDTPLSVDEVVSTVSDPRAGGLCVFIGAVREEDGGRSVTELGYDAHPGAVAELRRVAEEVVAAYPVCGLAAVHRIGDLGVGEIAVIVGVSAPHRAEAFDACRMLIDNLKAQVPLWKHQRFTDGSTEWVGAE